MSSRLLLILLSSSAIVLIAPFLGMVTITPALLGHDAFTQSVFWDLRVPRVIIGFVAGSTLALSGMVFQAIFRNPLATHDTLGVSSGASFGASVAILFGARGAQAIGALPLTTIGAFGGALLAILFVYAFSSIQRRISTLTMLLAGIAVGFLFSSLMMFAQYLSSLRDSFQIVRWLMGGLDVNGYQSLILMGPAALIGAVVIGLNLHRLNLLLTGEDLAQSRGVDVARVKTVLLLTASLCVAAVVSVCGPIGFVGLMVPHMCRMIFGSDHRVFGVATWFVGGAFLVACDVLARIIVAPAEMPVGVITALLGGPFFLWILFRSMRRRQGELW